VSLAVIVAIVGLSVATAALGSPNGSPPSLQTRGKSLAQREHAALLDLYAAESSLARAQSAAATVHARQAAVAAGQRSLRRRAAIIRASLRVAQARIGQALRDLYMQGQPDPIAIFLGAESLDDAIASIDSITRSTRRNKRLIGDMRRTQGSVRKIELRLAARSQDLAAASAAATASTARFQRAVEDRVGVVSSLRRQQDITRLELARLEQQAKAAQQRSAKLTPAPAPAPTAAPAPATTTATPSAPAPAPSGTRTLVVDAVAYHLPGKTASGLPVGVGVIAVDPRVIPLGTRVFVPGYGPAVAADVGTAIIGNIIDLWMSTTAQARAWGRRTVTITIYG
jgi:3D (Asp-Asp-Asp) domain-containing protein